AHRLPRPGRRRRYRADQPGPDRRGPGRAHRRAEARFRRAAGRDPHPGWRRAEPVAVTERHPALDPARVPMVFDLAEGLYWRPDEGGLLFGMSNPDEPPSEHREVD